jgi:hypothetical protein
MENGKPEIHLRQSPFCSGVLEPKIGTMKCPGCHSRFEYDDRMESVFVDTEDLRLPAHGIVYS